MYIVFRAQLLLVLFIYVFDINFSYSLLPQYKTEQILYYTFIRSSNGIFVSIFFYNVSVALQNSSNIHGLLPNTVFFILQDNYLKLQPVKSRAHRLQDINRRWFILSLDHQNSKPQNDQIVKIKLIIQTIILESKTMLYLFHY